jgi:hypothetical protein
MDLKRNRIGDFGLDSSGSGCNTSADSYEHDINLWVPYNLVIY